MTDECNHGRYRPIRKLHCYICGKCRKVLDRHEAARIMAAYD